MALFIVSTVTIFFSPLPISLVAYGRPHLLALEGMKSSKIVSAEKFRGI